MQYWMKIRYDDGVERWELTRGQFASEQAALKGYEARTRSMNSEILEVQPHEQLELELKEEPSTGCDYGIGG